VNVILVNRPLIPYLGKPLSQVGQYIKDIPGPVVFIGIDDINFGGYGVYNADKPLPTSS
jgi:hypothetical protein